MTCFPVKIILTDLPKNVNCSAKKDAQTTQIRFIKDGAHISRLVKLTVVTLQR